MSTISGTSDLGPSMAWYFPHGGLFCPTGHSSVGLGQAPAESGSLQTSDRHMVDIFLLALLQCRPRQPRGGTVSSQGLEKGSQRWLPCCRESKPARLNILQEESVSQLSYYGEENIDVRVLTVGLLSLSRKWMKIFALAAGVATLVAGFPNVAGAATYAAASGAPVKIGWINVQGGSSTSEPDLTVAAKGMVQYANVKTWRIAGRPIDLVPRVTRSARLRPRQHARISW